MTLIGWRGVDVFGDRFADLAEVREAGGETSGAFVFDAEAGTGELVDVQPIGASVVWGVDSNATAYVDRGRVWLDGLVATSGGSGALGTLPSGKRPAATVYLDVTFTKDAGGTPAFAVGQMTVTSSGVVTVNAHAGLTGIVLVYLTGLSFKVAP